MTKTIIKTIGTIVIVEIKAFVLKSKVRMPNTKTNSKQKIARILSNNDNLYFL
ncbi:MAG: hypothetical protein V7719_10415 [Psychroserpens sp.]|uniref:hypothetical protein n=1 Tax=Psychroserpens sp. TaxID=2020870 RepID=UPI003002D1E5